MFSTPKPVLLLFSLFFMTTCFGQSKRPEYDFHRRLDSLSRLAQLPSRLVNTRGQMLPFAYRSDANRRPATTRQFIQARQQAICFDTSERYFLATDSVTYYSHNPVLTPDGHFLISGEYARWDGSNWDNRAYLMKADQKGAVIWLRTYDSLSHEGYQYINFQKLLPLKDGTVFLAGRTNNRQGENDDIIFVKTDGLGNIVWSRLYKSRLWTQGNGSADYWVPHEAKEDPSTGDIYISAALWTSGSSIIKLNPVDGSIIWSRSYMPYDYAVFDAPLGLDIRANEVRFFTRFLSYRNVLVSAYRLSKQTGDTLQTRFFQSNDTTGFKVDFLGNDQLTVLQNGNYALSGKTHGQYQYMYNGLSPLYQAAVLELDSSLNFVRAYAFRNYLESNGYNSRMTVFPDGTALFSMLRYFSGYTFDVHYVQTRDGQIVKQRRRPFSGEGLPYEPAALRFRDGSDVIVRLLGDSATNQNKIEVLRMHTSDISSDCLGVDDASTSIYPFIYEPANWGLDSVRDNLFYDNGSKTLTVISVQTTKTPGCFTVAQCDSLKLMVARPTICLGEPLLLTVRKNKACGASVPLRLDTSVVQSTTAVNDSTYSIRFKKAWTGYIAGSLQSCTLLWDSLQVRVSEAPAALDLGPNKELCPGNTIILNARAGYANYQWQDGATDSMYTVNKPGLYYVTATDACGGTYRDSVYVSAALLIPFNAGPDRTKCNSDTVQLNAPAGFMNYAWSNNYNISSLTSQNVVVNPQVDTAYYIKAEKTPGCFAYDTVRITVHTSPPIDLGADKSFCFGDSAIVNAGAGFQNYLWSSGQATQQILLKAAGKYSVIATTAESCKSYDTIGVINVYPLPQPNLEKNISICKGEGKILQPGSFVTYHWSTGEQSSFIVVNAPGSYFVSVTDGHGCVGSDTTSVVAINSLPAGFLPSDTAICSYEKLELKPLSTFASYLWNTGSNTPGITITEPGLYWLQVQDINNCKGKDTINVFSRDCMSGFFAPSAFTPNGDGKNDQFRPRLFGNVKKYLFTVYNRWGQVVFQTKELGRGWDGKVAGVSQESSVFVWMCTYQFEGEAQKAEKGTVTLVR